MASGSIPRAWPLVVIVVTIAGVAQPSMARACSCPERGGYALWPRNGERRVPIDTPLVFARYNLGGPTEAIEYELLGPDGSRVPLRESSRLPAAYIGCGGRETLFLRPADPLEPNTKYVFRALPDAIADGDSVSFSTGDGERASPEPELNARLEYLLVTAPSCNGPLCLGLAEAWVSLEAPPRAPRWLIVESAALENGRSALVFDPADPRYEAGGQLSVTLPAGDRCIEAVLYGVEGTPLWQERRCEPDRCARTESVMFNFCGGPPYSGLKAPEVPAGSCDSPPTLDPQADKPPEGDPGCRALPFTGSGPTGLLLAPALWLAARRRRQRWG